MAALRWVVATAGVSVLVVLMWGAALAAVVLVVVATQMPHPLTLALLGLGGGVVSLGCATLARACWVGRQA